MEGWADGSRRPRSPKHVSHGQTAQEHEGSAHSHGLCNSGPVTWPPELVSPHLSNGLIMVWDDGVPAVNSQEVLCELQSERPLVLQASLLHTNVGFPLLCLPSASFSVLIQLLRIQPPSYFLLFLLVCGNV